MTVGRFNKVTVTVQRTVRDEWDDTSHVDHHQIRGCTEYPTVLTTGSVGYSAESSAAGGEVVTDGRVLLVPSGSDVLATDRILIHPSGVDVVPVDDTATRRHNVYQVLGRPMDWVSPLTGSAPGMQVSLVRVS